MNKTLALALFALFALVCTAKLAAAETPDPNADANLFVRSNNCKDDGNIVEVEADDDKHCLGLTFHPDADHGCTSPGEPGDCPDYSHISEFNETEDDTVDDTPTREDPGVN